MASSATRWGSVAFASERIRSISSLVGEGTLRRSAYFAIEALTHSDLLSKKANAFRFEMYGGKDRRTSPEGLTEIVVRVERRVQEIVISPNVGWRKTSFILSYALAHNLKEHNSCGSRHVQRLDSADKRNCKLLVTELKYLL